MMIEGLAVARHGKDDPTDSIPAFGEKPKVTRAGDLWVLGRQRVYCEARNDSVAEEEETHVIQTPYGAQRFERRTGEALHAEREALDLLKSHSRNQAIEASSKRRAALAEEFQD